jgi:Tol biopolymer transport system component
MRGVSGEAARVASTVNHMGAGNKQEDSAFRIAAPVFRWGMAAGLALLLGLAGTGKGIAQVNDPLSPYRPWRTLETEHFVVHYPAEKEAWTLPVAARLDSVHAAVSALVGNAPRRRTTTVVADPFNVSNGFALPFIGTPTMVLWTTPPEPRSGIGEHRDWAELLAVHEYAHVAHLAWPSRNARQRLLWSLLPVHLGPVTRRSPRWAVEGYATYIEGRLTGTGRPHGAWRPTTLRQWAIEGRLPTYEQMSAWDAYQGGAMAYLVGSAFLEWLVEQRGEQSLNHVWRRMTAVQTRSFGDAFAGVFGGPPDELYGRFTVAIMREALEAERVLRDAGLIEGERFQRLGWHTGDPAVSPDGTRLAIVLRQRGRPSRVVIWSTDPPEPLVREEERQRLLDRDPLDVPAIEWRPRPKEALATLHPVAGRGHDHPRFLPDGQRLLVTRPEPLPDGRVRLDLFLWDSRRDDLQRITRGAGVRHPDPSPDGLHAAAVRCENGICDLVRVDLRTGGIRVLRPGSPDRVFYRPRWAADGERIAVAVQEAGRWRIALTDAAGTALRYVDPDDGYNRYDAAWLPDADALVVVSHRGGVANLERIEVGTGAVQPLTRTTGAALGPAPHPTDGSLFFLRLHTRGLDLNRLPTDAPRPADVVDLAPLFARVAPTGPAQPVDTFPLAELPPSRPYGLGPQTLRLLPGGNWSAQGDVFALTLTGSDPIGRLGWTLTGAAGDAATWRGGGLEAVWRGIRAPLRGNLWWAAQRPTRRAPVPEAVAALDAGYGGAAAWSEATRIGSRGRQQLRIGASYGGFDRPDTEHETRRLAFAELESGARFGSRTFVAPSLRLHGSAGHTAGTDWQRGMAHGRLVLGSGGLALVADATYGTLRGQADAWEAFVVGGPGPLVFNEMLLPQRIPAPAVPLGTLQGADVLALRAATSFGPLQPFFQAISTDDGFEDWYRIVGAESVFDIGPAPIGRLPRVRVSGGIGYPLDEPFRHRLRSWLSVEFRP